ncbi:GFA family protein [Labrenzia sp. CE80]|uniref:GFA family protein n=1 Tax=Labrenzia sp. CE80 TaxID=1788986 RepID=UPI00129AA36B|nr:GFA family protein [Labrenzia sp. CE80]
MRETDHSPPITGRCYCGASTISANAQPSAIAYCHCADCRRVTGAPVSAFAAFDASAVTISSAALQKVTANPGVTRTFCGSCGSPIAGSYDYLPGQTYISLGLLDQIDVLSPQMHAHADARPDWLCIKDDLPRFSSSSRDKLKEQSS